MAAADFFAGMAQRGSLELPMSDFAVGVLLSRDELEGGEFHRRLQCEKLMQTARLSAATPAWSEPSVQSEVFGVLDAAAEAGLGAVTSAETLKRAQEAQAARATQLSNRLKVGVASPEAVAARRREVRRRADLKRAAELTERPAREESIDRLIEDTTKQLTLLKNLPPQALLAFRQGLHMARFDPASGKTRSKDLFQEGCNFLLAEAAKLLDLTHSSLCEYTMAEWKVICDKAMSKFRPYERKAMTSSSIDVIRHQAAGTPLRQFPQEAEKHRRPAEAFEDEAAARQVQQHLQTWLGAECMPELLARLQEMQLYRQGLMEVREKPGFESCPELQMSEVSAVYGLDPFPHLHQLFPPDDRAASFVALATMSPLGLLSLLASFVSELAEEERLPRLRSPTLWGEVLRWERKQMKARSSKSEFEDLRELLTINIPCPRCGSAATKQVWLKTRSDDEQFKFQLECSTCQQSTTL